MTRNRGSINAPVLVELLDSRGEPHGCGALERLHLMPHRRVRDGLRALQDALAQVGVERLEALARLRRLRLNKCQARCVSGLEPSSARSFLCQAMEGAL